MSLKSGSAGIPVLILKDRSTRSRISGIHHANIKAARIVAETAKTSPGPKSAVKMPMDNLEDVMITSDSHTILKNMDIHHHATKMLVEVTKTRDDNVEERTTTSIITAGEF